MRLQLEGTAPNSLAHSVWESEIFSRIIFMRNPIDFMIIDGFGCLAI
jgi:hypothetical protein